MSSGPPRPSVGVGTAIDLAIHLAGTVVALRALGVQSCLHDDLAVLAVLPVFLVFRVDRAMHLERLD